MNTATITLSPKAGIAAKVSYCRFAYYMRTEFEKRIEADARKERRTGTPPPDAEKNIDAFTYWDMQYKLKNIELETHYEKFDTGALMNQIDNA